jgi:hypothetical protein
MPPTIDMDELLELISELVLQDINGQGHVHAPKLHTLTIRRAIHDLEKGTVPSPKNVPRFRHIAQGQKGLFGRSHALLQLLGDCHQMRQPQWQGVQLLELVLPLRALGPAENKAAGLDPIAADPPALSRDFRKIDELDAIQIALQDDRTELS